MDNCNIQLRDWNKNEIVDKTIPLQQLKKIYLDDMKMGDLEMNFKRCKSEEDSKTDKYTKYQIDEQNDTNPDYKSEYKGR